MKKVLFLFLFILGSSYLYPSFKINSYNINAKLDKTGNQIIVKAEIELQNNNSEDTLTLLFSSNCRIHSIKDKLNENEFDINYFTGGKDTIHILLNEELKKQPKFILEFDYDYPVGEDTVILLDRGYRWYPLIAENIETFSMSIEVPSNYMALTAGEFLKETTDQDEKQYYFESTRTVFKIPLIIAPENYYNVNELDCGTTNIYFYSIASNNYNGLDSVNIDICNLIKYFNKTIGEYPYRRFSLVETSAFQGSNLGSSIITAGSDNIKYYFSGFKEWLNMDVASQWVCAGIFPRLFCKGFWFMSISFPHYLRLMYIKDTKGEDAFKNSLNSLKEKYEKVAGSENEIPVIDIDYPNSKEKGLALYAKGVLVIDKIRNELGGENWIKFLRYFYEEYNGKTITLDTLTDSINKFDRTGACSNHLLKMLSGKGMPE